MSWLGKDATVPRIVVDPGILAPTVLSKMLHSTLM
jgi:hypothetical protein